VRVLLTNDDGIEADGLQALRRALSGVPGVDLRVVAPDGNRSAIGRAITIRRPIWVKDVDFGDGTMGFATDGTPVDCVRLAHLGLIDGWQPEMVISGINHGSNIGDDITYSGTVAAALEAIILDMPGIAISQQSSALELDYRRSEAFDFTDSAAFTARLVEELESVPLPKGTLINVNFPGAPAEGVSVAPLGRRYYSDELEVLEQDDSSHARRRLYRVYGEVTDSREEEVNTDVAAIAAGRIAITPLHFDLTYHQGVQALIEHELERFLPDTTEPRG
jgi:5'-nucleotidase